MEDKSSSSSSLHHAILDPKLLAPAAAKESKKLTLVPLMFLIYFEVSGGPYGSEPAVRAAGPLLSIVGFLVFPFVWSVPEALLTAELSTALPGNGGFVVWADRAFGPFFGSLMGTWKLLSGVINSAAFPVLCADYLSRALPGLASGWPRTLAVVLANLVLSLVNYMGLTIVGYASVALCAASLLPFLIMSGAAAPRVRPRRWGRVARERDWSGFFNCLFWNLNFWDNASTMAGEVEQPQRTFPRALMGSVLMTVAAYLAPLLAVTGALDVGEDAWGDGFYADAAGMITGKWLKYWIEVGAVLSAIGLYEAQLSSSAFQLLGMADLGFLPHLFASRSEWFDTPWVGILTSSLITLAVSFMSFSDIIASANFLYSLGMLLEIASFLWLRRKHPTLKRPYKVPLGTVGLACMCFVPSAFLIFVMTLATWKVAVISLGMTAFGVGLYFAMNVCRSRGCLKFSKGERVGEEEEEEERHDTSDHA